MKTLSAEAKRARCEHDSFIIMLHASVTWPQKWDAGEILGTWFSRAFPGQDLTEEDFNEQLIDRIRRQLLINAGITSPILSENHFTKQVKKELQFN